MMRYAMSSFFALLAVLTVFVVMQSFVVGRQFQFTTAVSGGNDAGVVNLGNTGTLSNQSGALPQNPADLKPPPLPEDQALARLAPPEVAAPTLGLPGFKPVFTAVPAQAVVEAAPEAAPAPAAAGPAAQPTIAVGDLVLVDRVDPKFPTEALRNGIQTGSVTVKFTVQPDGSVNNLSVTDAKPRRGIFDQAALRAVARWKFKPIAAPKDSVITLDFSTEGGG
jgi:protein TonB